MLLSKLLLQHNLLKTKSLPVRQDLLARDLIPGSNESQTPNPDESEVPTEATGESTSSPDLTSEIPPDNVSVK